MSEDAADTPLVERLDPIPVLPYEYREPVARAVWFVFAPAYIAGLLLSPAVDWLGENIHTGFNDLLQPLVIALVTPCFYLYERYWAP